MTIKCFICSQELAEGIADYTVKETYTSILGILFPENQRICYICVHQLRKICKFRNVCISSQIKHIENVNNSQSCEIIRLPTLCNYAETKLQDIIVCTNTECTGKDERISNKTSSAKNYSNIKYDIGSVESVSKDDCRSLISDDLNVRSIEIDKELTYKNQKIVINDELNNDEHDDIVTNDDNNSIANTDNGNEVDSGRVETEPELDCDDDDKEINDYDKERNDDVKFTKIVLSVEEQKAELESMRRTGKFVTAQYKCYSCALTFVFKDSYKSHMVRHEESNGEYSCSICTLRFASANGRRMHRALHSERHRCERCGARVKPNRRRQHGERCSGRDKAVCHHCDKTYRDKINLQAHLRRVHYDHKNKSRLFQCNICNKIYKNAATLRGHMIGAHSNGSFRCDVCPSVFRSPYALRQHSHAHSKVSTHFCAQCCKSFKNLKSYNGHVASSVAHSTNEFVCSVCGHISPSKNLLDLHAQKHTEARHACVICGQLYHTVVSLKRHMKRHLDAKPSPVVVCHYCGKSIKGKSKLKRHMDRYCKSIVKSTESQELPVGQLS